MSRRPDIQPRGLNREQAAAYIGVGTTLFAEMVRDGRMPEPVRIGGRTVWDRFRLDAAFDDLLPANGADTWGDVG